MSYTVYPGSPARWTDFIHTRTGGELERFRTIILSLRGTNQGVRVFGNVGVTSHFGDICRMAQVPSIFMDADDAKDQLATVPAADRQADALEARLLRAMQRANIRVLVRIGDVEMDEDGNARAARVEHLDRTGMGARWINWRVGKRISLNGFRITLRNTKRAGLHLRVGAVIEDSPRDANGYRTLEPRYLGIAKISGNGVMVVRPHDPIDPAYLLTQGSLPEDRQEAAIVREAVIHLYGAGETAAGLYMTGRGSTLSGPEPEYAWAA